MSGIADENHVDNLIKIENEIKSSYEKIFYQKNSFDAADIWDFGSKILDELVNFFKGNENKGAGYIVYINRTPKDFESKIEQITAYRDRNNFHWWSKYERAFLLPNIENFVDILFPGFSLISKENFKKNLLKSLKDYKNEIKFGKRNPINRDRLVSEINEIFEYFPSSLIQIFLGHQKKLDVFILLGIGFNPTKYELYSIKSLVNSISDLISNMQYETSAKRNQEVITILENIAKLEIKSNNLFYKICDEIKSIFPKYSEIGVFPRFADRISTKAEYLIGTNQEKVDSEFSGKSLKITERKTTIAYVAHKRKPYYCDYIELNEEGYCSRHPHYYPTVENTLSQYTIPLIYKNDLVGILNVGLKYQNGFIPVDRRALEILASHAASAMYHQRSIMNFRNIVHMLREDLSNIINSKSTLEKIVKERSPAHAINWLFQSIAPSYKILDNSLYIERPFELKEIDIINIIETVYDKKYIKEHLVDLGLDVLKTKKYNSNKKVTVTFNEKWLVGIISNLLNNAIKACKNKSESVDSEISYSPLISVDIKENLSNKVVVEITDNGKQVLEEEIEEMFLPGRREYIEGNFNGGIGLWIADELLAKTGGLISFNQGNGLKVFSIHLLINPNL